MHTKIFQFAISQKQIHRYAKLLSGYDERTRSAKDDYTRYNSDDTDVTSGVVVEVIDEAVVTRSSVRGGWYEVVGSKPAVRRCWHDAVGTIRRHDAVGTTLLA